jgi:hypothetical protein
VFVFFNKNDVFQKRLAYSPLKNHFAEYCGESFESACQYIEDMFRARSGNRQFCTCFTCAVDDQNPREAFELVDVLKQVWVYVIIQSPRHENNIGNENLMRVEVFCLLDVIRMNSATSQSGMNQHSSSPE